MACVVGTRLVGTGDPRLQNPNFSRTTTRSALSSLGRSCRDEDRVRLPEADGGRFLQCPQGWGLGLDGQPSQVTWAGTLWRGQWVGQ